MTVTLVEKYNPIWPVWFEEIKAYLGKRVSKASLRIEHIGSTSIRGMIAKPIIDIIIVIEPGTFPQMKKILEEMGYYYRGDLGQKDREVFRLIDETPLPLHHLYVCAEGQIDLVQETAFRDYMRKHKKDRERLGILKWELCEKFNNDRQLYMDGKDAMVKEITKKALEYSKKKK
jgi:GrpB-like predicted nucleotidyltransferase (UPF0157 family)